MLWKLLNIKETVRIYEINRTKTNIRFFNYNQINSLYDYNLILVNKFFDAR